MRFRAVSRKCCDRPEKDSCFLKIAGGAALIWHRPGYSSRESEYTGFELDSRVIQHEPLGFHDYNCLQMNAFAVVSDSGTLPEESSFFTSVGHPFPAICIRTSTERPEALDKACFILSGIDEKGLLQSVDTAVELNKAGDYGIPVPDYIEENVSTKVVKIIQSYTGVVNKMVWRKDI